MKISLNTTITSLQAGLTNLWQMIVSAILPCIGYYFLYGKDSTLLGPQAWTVLALIVIVGIVVRYYVPFYVEHLQFSLEKNDKSYY